MRFYEVYEKENQSMIHFPLRFPFSLCILPVSLRVFIELSIWCLEFSVMVAGSAFLMSGVFWINSNIILTRSFTFEDFAPFFARSSKRGRNNIFFLSEWLQTDNIIWFKVILSLIVKMSFITEVNQYIFAEHGVQI